MTDKTDIAALREAALKATPGNWKLGIGSTYAYVQAAIDMKLGGRSWVKLCHFGRAGWRNQQSTIDDARFIALANPANIIALLDQIEVVSKSEWKLAGELVELQMTFNALQQKYEAERQRADAAHKYGSERDSENESLMHTVGRLRVEIAELKGDQKPYGYYSAETETILEQQGHASISAEPLADSRFPLFTAPQKPVVTLPALPTTPIVPTQPFSLHDIMRATRNMDIKAIEAAGCIVKDGE